LTDRELLQKLTDEFDLFKKETGRIIGDLQRENAALKERLARYENPKNSGNSGIPPSQDPFRKTKSLRGRSNRPRGGQKGHKGSKLEMSVAPDAVVVHDIGQCSCCGNGLEGDPDRWDARQVFDIPPIKVEVTEHRRMHRTCGNCGTENLGTFPDGLVQEAQYGNRLKSLCVYLQNYHMLPFARCREMIADLTGHNISTGSLSNFQGQCFDRLEGYERDIREMLLQSPVLHADETGIRLSGKNSWMHVVSNGQIGFFAHHPNRGKQAMDSIGLLERYTGTLVHDRFSSYFSYNCGHALCNAHILRDLVHVEEAFDAGWAKGLRKLLVRAKRDRERDPGPGEGHYSRVFRKYIGYIRPVIRGHDKKFKKTPEQRLAFALEKHKHLFLKFLEQPHIPFDNNQAERDLRMIKVKQKVSGCFRSQQHAQYFARIRGYISTIKKNNEKVLDNIQAAFLGNPYLPLSNG